MSEELDHLDETSDTERTETVVSETASEAGGSAAVEPGLTGAEPIEEAAVVETVVEATETESDFAQAATDAESESDQADEPAADAPEEKIDAARIETFTENLRITVAITDAYGKPLQAQADENGEVYVVSSQGTRLIKTEEETQKTRKSKRGKRALGLLCFFSILFIAIAIILDVIFKNALPDLEYVGTIFSSFAQAVAYLFLAIHGFKWIMEPGRKLGWKIVYWVGVALVFVTLIVGTTLAFTHLIPTK